jgi:hypothetical protein
MIGFPRLEIENLESGIQTTALQPLVSRRSNTEELMVERIVFEPNAIVAASRSPSPAQMKTISLVLP